MTGPHNFKHLLGSGAGSCLIPVRVLTRIEPSATVQQQEPSRRPQTRLAGVSAQCPSHTAASIHKRNQQSRSSSSASSDPERRFAHANKNKPSTVRSKITPSAPERIDSWQQMRAALGGCYNLYSAAIFMREKPLIESAHVAAATAQHHHAGFIFPPQRACSLDAHNDS